MIDGSADPSIVIAQPTRHYFDSFDRLNQACTCQFIDSFHSVSSLNNSSNYDVVAIQLWQLSLSDIKLTHGCMWTTAAHAYPK